MTPSTKLCQHVPRYDKRLFDLNHLKIICKISYVNCFLYSTDGALSAWNARRESSTAGNNSQAKESIVPNLVILDTRNKQLIDADVVAR